MIDMRDAVWFAAGLLCALAASLVLQPWLARLQQPRLMRALQWCAAGVLTAAGVASTLFILRGGYDRIPTGAAAAVSATGHGPDSLQVMLARIEGRLRGGGGTPADWELLAQSYDFLGRHADASAARTRHMVAAATPATADAGGKWPLDLAAQVVEMSNGAAATGSQQTAADVASTVAPPAASAKTRLRVQHLLDAADRARKNRDYAAAKSAYQQLVALGQMSAQSWADYADVSASSNGGSFDGAPQEYVERALSLEPANEKALWLKASAQHHDQQYAGAVQTWTQLLVLTPANSADAKIFTANLAEDQQLAAANPGAQAQGSAVQVTGEVTLAESLKDKVPAGSTLFIVARSVNSPGAPVAVVRTQTGQWPLPFRLDDSLAMLPDRKLSTAGAITVEARVSKGGGAASQPGDLHSAPAGVDPRAGKPVHLVIDRVIG